MPKDVVFTDHTSRAARGISVGFTELCDPSIKILKHEGPLHAHYELGMRLSLRGLPLLSMRTSGGQMTRQISRRETQTPLLPQGQGVAKTIFNSR